MTKLAVLKDKLQKTVDILNSAKQLSKEWFAAKAEVEALSQEINKIEFVNHQKANRCPDDFVFEEDGWDD